MSGYYDVYVWSADRTGGLIHESVDEFASQFSESAADYHVPRFADSPTAVFESARELIDYCLVHPNEPHSLYWRNPASADPAHVMLFFKPDAAVIFGLSVLHDPQRWLDALLEFTKSENGYVTFEEHPPDTFAEFQAARVRNAGLTTDNDE